MARKQDKLRPYRVDYFNIDEMKDNDMALVRSTSVRAVTSAEAATKVLDDNSALPIVLIRSYRFYKKITNNGTSYKAVEDLFNEKNALIVMEEVEKYRAEQAQTNDLGNTPAAQTQMDAVATQADTAVIPDHATPDPAFGVERATFYKTNAGTQVQAVAPPQAPPDENGHVTRFSDSSLYDEVCINCGATDTGGSLDKPCPSVPTSGPTSPATVAAVNDLNGFLSHDAHEQLVDKVVVTSTEAEGRRYPTPENTLDSAPITPFGEKCPECEDGINSPMPGTADLRDSGITPTWQKILLFAGMLGTIMLLLWLILPHK